MFLGLNLHGAVVVGVLRLVVWLFLVYLWFTC